MIARILQLIKKRSSHKVLRPLLLCFGCYLLFQMEIGVIEDGTTRAVVVGAVVEEDVAGVEDRIVEDEVDTVSLIGRSQFVRSYLHNV